MGVDVDPKTLEVSAAASAHAHDQAVLHVGEEIKARDPKNLTALMASLAPEGPYAYTIMPRVGADGSIQLPVLTTREEIAEAYELIRGLSDLHEVIGLTEIAGTWYLFQDAMTVGGPKDSAVRNHRQTLGLFPSGVDAGITGELVWLRSPRELLGGPDDVDVFADDDELHARYRIHRQYQRYLEGLRSNDLDSLLEPLHDGAASAVRDYVAGTGALIELSGKDAHRAFYGELLASFEVRDIRPLHLVVSDWYVFGELRITADRRDGSGTVAFHTAEFHVPARDGRFIARIGHGTDPV
jgi:hypothetical protein